MLLAYLRIDTEVVLFNSIKMFQSVLVQINILPNLSLEKCEQCFYTLSKTCENTLSVFVEQIEKRKLSFNPH